MPTSNKKHKTVRVDAAGGAGGKASASLGAYPPGNPGQPARGSIGGAGGAPAISGPRPRPRFPGSDGVGNNIVLTSVLQFVFAFSLGVLSAFLFFLFIVNYATGLMFIFVLPVVAVLGFLVLTVAVAIGAIFFSCHKTSEQLLHAKELHDLEVNQRSCDSGLAKVSENKQEPVKDNQCHQQSKAAVVAGDQDFVSDQDCVSDKDLSFGVDGNAFDSSPPATCMQDLQSINMIKPSTQNELAA